MTNMHAGYLIMDKGFKFQVSRLRTTLRTYHLI